jgi:hypothetical protein
VCAQLGDHGVVVHTDGGTFKHTGVDAHSVAVVVVHLHWLTVGVEGADGRQESSVFSDV